MERVTGVKRAACGRVLLAALALGLVSACDEGGNFTLLQPAAGEEGAVPDTRTRSTRLVERDVEAPGVSQATDMGLWDGRPSLGGVWVAHPDVADPERVIIRNTADGKFVIGALFRRQREAPGPAFQVSSDAAAALGMIAGSPQQLNVTALRREEAPAGDENEDEAAAPASGEPVQDIAPAPGIEARDLDPVAGAEAAIEAAELEAATAAPQAPAAAARPEPRPEPARPSSPLAKPFVQVGIFSIEENARNTATALRQAGMVPTVFDQSSQGKRFWRVVVGPAGSAEDRAVVLGKIREIGFADAYPVTN